MYVPSRRYVDLHTHSSASDGTDSPATLVHKAVDMGLAALALTDHDTSSGLNEAQKTAHKLGLEFIRGCELTSNGPYIPLHFLGFWLPEQDHGLTSLLNAQAERRRERNSHMLRKLGELGITITEQELERAGSSSATGRPHMARILFERGLVGSVGEAFQRYLGSHAPAYVRMEVPEPAQIVAALKATGATVALAHPMQIRCPGEWLSVFLRDMKDQGLDALEVYHADHSPAQVRQLVDMAQRLDLALVGGSDYHGKIKPGLLLGTGWGGLRVPLFVLEKLKELRRAQGLPV